MFWFIQLAPQLPEHNPHDQSHDITPAYFFITITTGYQVDVVKHMKWETSKEYTLRLLLLAGTNFSVLVDCFWQVFILAFFNVFLIDYK